MNDNLILRPRTIFADGNMEDTAYTPMSALSGEELMNISIEEHQILSYMRNYRKASVGECSWWEVYGNQLAVDAALAKMERRPRKVILKMELDSDFKNGIILRPRSKDCTFHCERAGFAARVSNVKVTIKYED